MIQLIINMFIDRYYNNNWSNLKCTPQILDRWQTQFEFSQPYAIHRIRLIILKLSSICDMVWLDPNINRFSCVRIWDGIGIVQYIEKRT